MTKASDDLADALFEKKLPKRWTTEGRFVPGKGRKVVVRIMLTQAQLRTLAREAKAMGAKKALEDIRDELNGLMDSLDDSVIADEQERLNVYEAIHTIWTMAEDAARAEQIGAGE